MNHDRIAVLVRRVVLSFMLIAGVSAVARPSAEELGSKLSSIRLPKNYRIELFAADVPMARGLAHGPDGTVLVGSSGAGKVYMIRDGKVTTLVSGLRLPIGVDYRDGSLFTGSVDRILRFDGVTAKTEKLGTPKTIFKDVPSSDHHGGRYLRVGPDGRLYVGVGAPCNVCIPEENSGTILSMNREGRDVKVFASGIRNTVGFDWQPGTGTLWFTDNGRDLMGDDIPSDELDRAPRAGLNFGFPYCHAGDIPDPEFKGKPCSAFEKPARKLGAHVAALGMRFYKGDVLIAEHGSWNRSKKIGYRIMRVKVQGDRAIGYEPFAEGWLQGEKAWGRPVDLLLMPDGSILVSDDLAGAIYRIRNQ